MAEAGIQNPLTLSSAAVTVFELGPGTRTQNPLTLNSAAVMVFEPGGKQLITNPQKPPWTSQKTNIKKLLSLVPRCLDFDSHVSSLDTDDLTGPADDSAPVTVRPLCAHDAGRRPILEHDVCRDGEKKMEQALRT